MPDLGKYEIIEEIGRGSYGIVYKGRDTSLDREVALKVLHPQLSADQTFARRFQREARTLARLRHSNIVTVYDIAEAKGQLYIAMELACGPSLATAIAERGRIPWQETLALLEPICQALDYAHQHGVVHRDLKPANILLDKESGPLLADFGIARLVGTSTVSLTVPGGIVGTPAYIAPEVWEKGVAEAPADIYALGCIAYEMLTGEMLFSGDGVMLVIGAHSKGAQFPAQWPDGVPDGVASILGEALVREPENRFTSAGEIVEALKQVVSESPVEEAEVESPAVAGRTSSIEGGRGRERQKRGDRAKRQKKTLPTILSPAKPFEPEMILIPAGKFLIGSDSSKDRDARDQEQPQHRLYLPDYYIAKTPVTNDQYLAFVQDAGQELPKHWEKGKTPRGKETHPVVNVSWRDAIAYCQWLAEVTGKSYRLASEAEWEKAARGIDGRIFPWGDQWDPKRCNSDESGVRDTTPVGKYSPEGDSPCGCVDMAGNVWEWTRSLDKDYPYNATDGREDLDAAGRRVLRGGAFYFSARGVRCAYRYGDVWNLRLGYVGFRVVTSPV
jgi:serine/threonine protein kinase